MNRVLKIKNLAFLFYGICAVILCGCRKEEPEKELPVPDTEFALLKYSLGKSYSYFKKCVETTSFAMKPDKEGCFLKNKNAFNKNLTVWTLSDSYADTDVVYCGTLYVSFPEIDTLKSVYRQWMNEFRLISDLSRMSRADYSISADNVKKSYDDIDAFMADVDRLEFQHDLDLSAQFVESNGYEYHFTLCFSQYLKGVEVQVSNRLALRKMPKLPMVNSIVGKSDDMLVMKVDYMTFNCLGYATVNVADAFVDSDTIPLGVDYEDPIDFGYIKLYYSRAMKENLLFSGSIVWMGCGKMEYPTNFVMEKKNKKSELPYPGNDHCAYMFRSYSNPSDDKELSRIWKSVSKTESFQWFYAHTTKKVAVYLYTPSVGEGDPADWYYLVFVENSPKTVPEK